MKKEIFTSSLDKWKITEEKTRFLKSKCLNFKFNNLKH